MAALKLLVMRCLDWLDDKILRHRFYPWPCSWLAEHPWWGEDECQKPQEGL